MRQKHETTTSFNQLEAITQAMITLKNGAPTNATNQESERTQTTKNANASDFKQQSALKPKATAHAQKGRLNPTKKAFSERQKTTIRDNTQASENKRLKTEQTNSSNLRVKPSKQAFKPGLAGTHQEKGGSNEA
ncbi:hypothetical protein ACR9KT_04850 [Helicobacter pylori]